MYEVFEHTADLGMRIRAPELEGLFAEAGRALFSLIVENPAEVRPAQRVPLEISGSDRVYLLFDWLNELLFLFDTRHLLFCDFEVHLESEGLKAVASGEPYDPRRHRLDHEVKAITYHHLDLRPSDGGWEAEVIVDI